VKKHFSLQLCVTDLNSRSKIKDMDISMIIGTTAFFVTILYLVLDYPMQNYLALRSEVPVTLLMSVKTTKLFMFGAWMAYGWIKKDAFILFGQGFGLLSALMIIGFMLWFKTRQRA
jgi:hypothetical protein